MRKIARLPEELAPNPDQINNKVKLLWISGGNQDGLIFIGQRTHKYLKEHNVTHIWSVDAGHHDFRVWKNDLYWFSQLIFQ